MMMMVDTNLVHKTWDKWASSYVGSGAGQPLKAALLFNHEPTGPSRLLSTIVKQEGIKADPIQLRQFLDFLKCGKLQTETFLIGPNQYNALACISPICHGTMVQLERHQVLSWLLISLHRSSIEEIFDLAPKLKLYGSSADSSPTSLSQILAARDPDHPVNQFSNLSLMTRRSSVLLAFKFVIAGLRMFEQDKLQ